MDGLQGGVGQQGMANRLPAFVLQAVEAQIQRGQGGVLSNGLSKSLSPLVMDLVVTQIEGF